MQLTLSKPDGEQAEPQFSLPSMIAPSLSLTGSPGNSLRALNLGHSFYLPFL